LTGREKPEAANQPDSQILASSVESLNSSAKSRRPAFTGATGRGSAEARVLVGGEPVVGGSVVNTVFVEVVVAGVVVVGSALAEVVEVGSAEVNAVDEVVGPVAEGRLVEVL